MQENFLLNNNESDRIASLERELALTKHKLKESNEKLAILMDNMPGGVVSYDADTGKFDFISSGCLAMFNCNEEKFRDYFYNCFDLFVIKADRERVKQQIKDQLDFFNTVELTYRVNDIMDNVMWIYHRGRLVEDENGRRMFYVVISDITEEKLVQNQMNMAAAKLRQKAEMDQMTGLFNKSSMQAAVEECLAFSGVGACHAMLMVDTDNFKSVNDTFGHQYGDKIIIFVADSIRKIFRDSDFVGRMGGDEFMVFMRNTTRNITEARAQKLNEAIRCDLCENGVKVSISCSIGIAFYDSDGDTYEKLYKSADSALYVAKENGKNQYVVYNAHQ